MTKRNQLLAHCSTFAFYLLLALCAGLLPINSLRAEELKIGGTGNALGTIRLLAERFKKEHSDINITVLDSLGSSGAIKAVPKKAIDIGLTSRALTAAELAAGSKAIEYALTPTVVAVSNKSKVTAISYTQIADLYAGRLANWPDGTPIRPVLRQPGDDNTRQLKGLSPKIEEALTEAEQRPGLAFAVTDQEAAEKMESIPGSIGVTSLALILSEGRRLHPLTLEGVEPTIENGVAGKYPIVKHFYFITAQTPSVAVKQFMDFVSSPAGHEILTETGHWFP